MKSALITIGIISMFLLTGISTVSIVAEDAVDIDKIDECKLITNLMSTLNLNDLQNQIDQEIVYENTDTACTIGEWTEQLKIPSPDGGPADQFGCSVCIDGDYLIIGAKEAGGIQTGAAYIFKRDDTNWIQEAKLIATDGTIWDQLGFSVSISGDYAIIGAPGQNDCGAAYIFKRDGTTWTQQQKLTGLYGSGLGISVSIYDDYALIGAAGEDDSKGSAYVFKRYENIWTQEARLVSSIRISYDMFGTAVSINEDCALIGAIEYMNIGKGSAYVFKRDGTTWTQQQKLKASDGAILDAFGVGVSIYGDYAAVGAVGNNNAVGATYVYKKEGSSWTEKDKLVPSDGATMDQFGASVSLCNEFLISGSYGDDNSKGSAYIYKRTIETWNEKQKIIASDGAPEDNFGWSVCIDGDYAFVGAPNDDVSSNEDGSAYVFVKPPVEPQPDLDCGGALSWTGIDPGATVTGEFYVENIGGEGSLLNWSIESYPDWGIWTFTPNDGTGLLPGNIVTVGVEVVAPDEPNTEFTGELKVINTDDPNDNCIIQIYLKTPLNSEQQSSQSQQIPTQQTTTTTTNK